MAQNTRELQCTPEDVFGVLGDGWLYPSWVVGASRMRDVDHNWPHEDSTLHHSVGVWPFLISDTTQVTEWSPPDRMSMRARGWPVGEAQVVIDVQRRSKGVCAVRIEEAPVKGPARGIPRPIVDPLIRWRNSETLRRLGFLAEGAARERERL
jgi:hypothetical protein